MRTKLRGKVTLLSIMFGLLLAIPAVALADNVINDVVVGTADDTIAKGGSTTINYKIVQQPLGADGQAGCNAADGSAANVTINTPAGVTADPASLTFTACQSGSTTNSQPVTFTSDTPGNYNITVDVSDSGSTATVGTYNETPATFTLHVSNVVDSVSPADGATDVPVGNNVSATFSGAMDTSTINSSTFTLVGPDTDADADTNPDPVAVDRSFSADKKTATLNPTSNLAESTTYTAKLEGGLSGTVVKDANGNPLVADYTWSFTTGVSKAATNLSLSADPNEAYYSDDVALTATLRKSSDSSAISGKTITFKDGTTTLGTATTGTNGEATLTKNDLSVGSHNNITASFAEDDDYFGSTSNSVSVNILAWVLNGFFSPVDMGTTLNTVKGGSTVPLKFEVSKATELTNTTAIKSFSTKAVPCPGTDTAVDEIEFTTTGGTSLRYDTTAGQFIQNWATPKKVGCHDVTMLTQDGSTLVAHFKLR